MKLKTILQSPAPVFSFEFFPPKTSKGEANLLRHVEKLKALGPSFFSMTYGAGGSTREKTVELGHRIREASGIETVCHVTCVGQSRDEVRDVILQIKSLGMENVMALRGDPPRGVERWEPHPDGHRHAVELVREISAIGGMSVAVAGFPETHPEATSFEQDLVYLREKVEAGADLIVTQLFFDNEFFYRFDREAKACGITVPIIPGVMPVRSVAQIRRIAEMAHARIPEKFEAELQRVDGDEEATLELGIDYAAAQIRKLLEYGVPGVHLYCLNRSELAVAIFKRLGRI